MTTFQQSRQERIDQMAMAQGGTGFFGGFRAAIGDGLRTLGGFRAGATTFPEARAASGEMSEIFARVVCENPNSAMDWLYYAAQLRSHEERRYCIARALQIDPLDEIVLAEVRRLSRGR